MTDEYPKRDRFFATKFTRHLFASGAVHELSHAAIVLVIRIAHFEDRLRYKRPVGFHNGQLADLLNLSIAQAKRIRSEAVEAGWLHYHRIGYRDEGFYWVTVPTSELLWLTDEPNGELNESLWLTDEPNDEPNDEPPPNPLPVSHKNTRRVRETNSTSDHLEDPDLNRHQDEETTRKPERDPEDSSAPDNGHDSGPRRARKKDSSSTLREDVNRVWAVYEHYHPKATLTDDRRKRIKLKLKNFDAETLTDAIHGNHIDPWCCGTSPDSKDGRTYHDFKTCLGDSDKIERYANLWRSRKNGKPAAHKPTIAKPEEVTF